VLIASDRGSLGASRNYVDGMRILYFTATTEGPSRLGLRELLQRYADEQWVAVHMTDPAGLSS
jgi:hypothetical protein